MCRNFYFFFSNDFVKAEEVSVFNLHSSIDLIELLCKYGKPKSDDAHSSVDL